jgi:hypothetical protein
MKILKRILIVIAALVLLAIVALWYIGLFSKVTVEDKKAGGYYLAGQKFMGPYMKVGETMNRVDKICRDNGITCTKGFGVYYDNPKTDPADSLRSFVGNIIEEKDTARLTELQTKGLIIDTFKVGQAMVVVLPIKTSLSYMIGPMKAYPAFNKYMEGKKCSVTACIEVYDMPAKKILYIMQYK